MQTSFGVDDKNGRSSPGSELDLYEMVVDSTVDDDFLAENRLGLGYYSDHEFWQQIQSYKNGMYGDAAFTRRLVERAVAETVTELGLNGYVYRDEDEDTLVKTKDGWTELDEDEQDEEDRRRFVRERGAEIWRQLPDDVKMEALEETTGISEGWKPPHWRMLQMRHEASRSRGARLLDNFFQRVRRVEGSDALKEAEEEFSSFDGRGRGGNR